MKRISDNEIIESVLRGNTADFALLVDRYKDKANSLLKRILKNDMDAEEALQDSFLKAYKSLANFQNNSKFSTWFYRIVYNTGLTALSTKNRGLTQIEYTSGDEEVIENDLSMFYDEDDTKFSDMNSTQEAISALVQQLPPKHSAVLNMFYLEDMTLEDISRVTGMTVANVKVVLHRSRNTLKDLIIKHKLHSEIF